jgi:hypothetical protein
MDIPPKIKSDRNRFLTLYFALDNGMLTVRVKLNRGFYVKGYAMGWGRTFFLGDIGNRLDIADCEEDVKVLKESLMQFHQEGQSQDAEIWAVQRENDQLKLYIASMIRLLMSKGVLSRDEIQKMVEIIDGEDGALDGKNRNDIL